MARAMSLAIAPTLGNIAEAGVEPNRKISAGMSKPTPEMLAWPS